MGYREDLEESNRSDKDPLAQLVCVAVVVATYWYAYSDKGREIIFNSTEYESSEIDWCEDNYAWSPHVSVKRMPAASAIVRPAPRPPNTRAYYRWRCPLRSRCG